MCGISGKIDFKSRNLFIEDVQKSCDAMIYRGPDNITVKSSGIATLGHCRLAIIDLSAEANQPFYSEDERYVTVFNGEIYNFQEVRNDLIKNYGIQFKTNSDTEVLLQGFICCGPSILTQLRGMWAFVIWDKQKEELFMSRDRFGEKPLFYEFNNGILSFASNLSGITKLTGSKSLNPNAISELFAYQYISHNHSIYEGLQKLPPASFATVSIEGIQISTYWNVNYSEKIDISITEAQDTIENILTHSIEEKLIADVTLGLFLSGGNDSGIVAAIASKFKKGINSITLSTPENPELDESIYAKQIAQLHGINYHQVDLQMDCINKLPKLLSMIEPFADSSIIPTTAVSEMARKHLTVVLTGDGGDEIFGGYGIPSLLHRTSKSNLPLGEVYKTLSNNRFQPGWKYMPKLASSEKLIKYGGILNYCNAMDYLPVNIKKLVFQPHFILKLETEQAFYPKQLVRQHPQWSDHDNMFYLGVKGYLPNDFLMKVDTGTMFASIESRAPFLDHRLIEFTSKLTHDHLTPGGVDKYLLKKICEKYLPKEIIYKKKTGFRIPVRDYFSGKWSIMLENLIKEGHSSDLGIINIEGSLKLIEWYKKAKPTQMDKLLFSMLVFEIWLRVFHLGVEIDEITL